MSIVIKRAYELPASDDDFRILVDRLWPRGLTKDKLGLDEWLKEIAPSDLLRRSFHQDEISRKTGDFNTVLIAEVDGGRAGSIAVSRLADQAAFVNLSSY